MRSTVEGRGKRRGRGRARQSASPGPPAPRPAPAAPAGSPAGETADGACLSTSPGQERFPGGEMLARSPGGSVQDLSLTSEPETEDGATTAAAVQGITALNISEKQSEEQTEETKQLSETAGGDTPEVECGEAEEDEESGSSVTKVGIAVTSPEGTTRRTAQQTESKEEKPAGQEPEPEREFTNQAGVVFEQTAEVL